MKVAIYVRNSTNEERQNPQTQILPLVQKCEREGWTYEIFQEFASGKKDPRKKFINAIKRKLGTKGSVIVYNQVFEQSRLKEIGELFPLEKQAVDKIIERMVDLLIPFRNFDYYDRKQEGSASIKYVLPAMTNMTYKGMEIANGAQASIRYAYIIHGDIDGNKAKKEEIKKIREDLKKYCGLDTEAMIMILNKLKEIKE